MLKFFAKTKQARDTDSQQNHSSLTEEGFLKMRRDLQKNIWMEITTIEDGTILGVYLKEAHYNLHVHKARNGKNEYYIEDNYKEQEVNIHVRSWIYPIPAKTREHLHLVASHKENLSFWKRIKYLFFHYYVVDTNFMAMDRLTSSKERLTAFIKLVDSLNKRHEPGKALNHEHTAENPLQPNNGDNSVLLN